MSETLNKSKLYSGRFLLCLCAALAMILFTFALAAILWSTRLQTEVNPAIMAGLALMSNLMTAIVTFYFSQRKIESGGV